MAEDVKEVSLLEKSLSLSQNGGIYYGGARVNADDKSAVLFVGLGGSGADALIRIKDQIKTRMILPSDKSGAPVADAPKNIGFLEIDTDESVQNIAYGIAKFDQFGNEFCDISVPSTPTLISDVRKAKAKGLKCWQWFDDSINAVSGAHGAGGIRQIGRLLMMYNIDKILQAVDGKIDSLVKDNPQIKSLVIFLFSGISGGTGAGTFLDMSYILRKKALEKLPDVMTMGYLIMTDVNELNGGKTEKLRTNGFSCLKELDYWMATGEHGERYRQEFPGNFELNELNCPFDFCHLLDASDVKGHSFSYDKILRSIAENTFAYIAAEVRGAEQATGSMPQMYSNIQGYITDLASTAKYPAGYNYLSLGASKIEIPYTEISTLIAARVFERLDRGMFRNRPTEQSFNVSIGRDLEITEDAIRGALYRNFDVPRPVFDPKGWNYQDVWPNNAPYQAAHNWIAMFQRSVVQQAGNLPAYLEGRLKEFIKLNLQNKKTGPIYLRYFVKSDETYCLYHMLNAFKKYCNELTSQCVVNSKPLKENMQQAFMNQAGGKKNAMARYLSALEAWFYNEEHYFLNEKIVEIIEKMQERLVLYYENILRPLSDILMELPDIFEKNVNYIKVHETQVDESTDILIRPLEFERTNKNDFNAAVLEAENSFLESLAKNIKKWIGRDIDEVDANIATAVDVPGFISGFVSSNFQSLLTINMEKIMNTRLVNGESLSDYVKKRVQDLINSSFPMYKESTGLVDGVEDFSILSVPSDCPLIYKAAKEHIEAQNLKKRVIVKRSEEKSRMYIIKISSGYPLYSNATIERMETAYEQMMSTTASAGNHLIPAWRDRLPSPFTELAWKDAYTCTRTLNRNEKYKGYFERCYANNVIEKQGDHFVLKRSNPEVAALLDKNHLSAQSTLGKMEQFEKIKARLWSDQEVHRLDMCGSYMKDQMGSEGEDVSEEHMKENIKENILRFPLLLDILEQECQISDRIEELDDELHYPKFFALVNINHMINTNRVTGDTFYRRTEQDPFPILIAKGIDMHPDFKEFQLYRNFCNLINPDIKEEIELQFENLKERIQRSSDAYNTYIKDINDTIGVYEKRIEEAQTQIFNVSKEDRPGYVEKSDFYKAAIEELKHMLPAGEDAEPAPAQAS
ncbi:MAG: tubulin-like doman-containing protein, partial [Eubacteriales bacterium]|nr:tubulin-like doman-containing protein [Eubacteriales bacterium]